MSLNILNEFDLHPAGKQPIHAGRVRAYPQFDLHHYLLTGSVDRISLWIHLPIEDHKSRPSLKKFRDKVLESTLGFIEVERMPFKGESNDYSRNFIITIKDPTISALVALEKTIRGYFGDESSMSLEEIVISIRGRVKRNAPFSEKPEHLFRLLERQFLPPGPPEQMSAGVLRNGEFQELDFEEDCMADIPIQFPRIFKAYRGDIEYALRLAESYQKQVVIQAKFNSNAVQKHLGLATLDDIFEHGLTGSKKFLNFALATPLDWRSGNTSLHRKLTRKSAELQLACNDDVAGIWQMAMSHRRYRRKTSKQAKLGFLSYEALNEKTRKALQHGVWSSMKDTDS